ncbi:hypothetical protein D5272_03245 [bacterium D16-76]|nr:hypothetical protein [bacterium D16-76]
MKKMLKPLSILQLVVGVLAVIVGIMSLVLANALEGAAGQAPVGTALAAMRVSTVLGLCAGVFDLGCGFTGLKGAGGSRKMLSVAVTLGWIGLAAAAASGVMMLFGDFTLDRAVTAVCSAVVPVLFLLAAIDARKVR